MRTRFLTPDFFNTNQTLPFLRFPLPTLQSSPDFLPLFFSIFDQEIPRCVHFSAIDDLHLERFPIENALSKFFSDVLPHIIHINDGDSHSDLQVSEKEDDSAYDDSASVSQFTSNSETHSEFSVERIQYFTSSRGENGPAIIEFEIPELSQHVENACLSEKEGIQFLSEVQECDDNLEMPITRLLDQYQGDIKDLVETVNVVCLESDIEQKPHIPEEIFPLLNKVHTYHDLYLLLEVDEIGMEDTMRHCMEFEFHTFIENIELQQCVENEDLERLGAVKIDILEHVGANHTSKHAFHVESLNLVLDIDILQIVETSYIERSTGMVNTYLIPSVETFLFEEFEMFDLFPCEIFEANSISHVMKEPETCHQLFHKEMNFKSFDELIVSHELTIIDGTFTSLPVPVLIDGEKTLSLHVMVVDILSELQPISFSAADEIYLDWHLLGMDKCNALAAIEKVFGEAEDSTIDSDIKPNDGSMLVFDFLLSDEPLDRPSMKENKLDMISGGSCTFEHQNTGVPSSRLSNEDCQIIENPNKRTNGGGSCTFEHQNTCVPSRRLSNEDCQIIENPNKRTNDLKKVESGRSLGDYCQRMDIDGMLDGDFGKPVSYLESTSHFNDLDFFLNPAKATGRMKIDCKVKELDDKSKSGHLYKSEVAPLNVIQMQQSGIQLHTVRLPDNFMILIGNLQRSYLAVFKDDTQLNKIQISVDRSNNINLLRLSEESLTDHMSKLSKQKTCTGNLDDSIMNLVTLCAIKRMAWCLSFCGMHTLHLFVCKLFERMDCLKSRLCFLHSLIDDAYGVVDKEITNAHPSLAIIKDILQKESNRKNKVLILALQFFWEPLKRLLSSLDISFMEVEDLSMKENEQELCNGFFNAETRDHLQTACLLLPHENISSSILMQKFNIILEYGGPSGVSKVSSLYSEYIGSSSLHFLKLELDDVAKALCKGVIVASTNRGRTKLEDLWNFGPIMENCFLVSSKDAGRTNLGSIHRPVCHVFQESEQIQPRHPETELIEPVDLSFPDTIIIVNTQNFNKEMIISRRSTYQKILSIEKRGGQVVERDLILPVDIIVDATLCIAWYDCNNIGMKATAEDEGSSSVPLCIENIAANVLTYLSFTFTSCVLIFEGESNFLGTVMESADELYAAAASLGIHLQIFFSYSIEQTDEIISSSIRNAMKFSKGLLPRLSESETLAESFLTKFPSMNPLSAHAIISSGCMLLKFFELSDAGRIHALTKYHVPDESINLFSVLCKYGEREESKSGVTDCSSSVSSPLDSAGNFVHKINSEDRKRKLIPNSSDTIYDFRCSRQSSEYMDEGWSGRSMPRPLDANVSKSLRICPEKTVHGLFDDELFGQVDVSDTGTNKDASIFWCKPNVSGTTKNPQNGDGFPQASMVSDDCFFDQQISGITIRNKRQQHEGAILEDLHQDFIGEVVDIYDKPLSGERFQTAEKAKKSSLFVREVENDHIPKHNRTARRLSFGTSGFPNFSMTDEMNTRCSLEDDRQYDDCIRVDNSWSNNSFKPQKGPISVNFMKATQNVTVPFSTEKNLSVYGETPLSKAVNLAQPQQGSPWTIEFLNRIKEKRRLRQQHQPCIASVPHCSHHGNMNKFTKKRSPSILEYYKYQGGSTPRKSTEQKRQKQFAQSLNEKPSGNLATWTPIDKKARRTLSFASGTGSQTKLVWRDDISCSKDRRFYS